MSYILDFSYICNCTIFPFLEQSVSPTSNRMIRNVRNNGVSIETLQFMKSLRKVEQKDAVQGEGAAYIYKI